jgi:hypothetical protein
VFSELDFNVSSETGIAGHRMGLASSSDCPNLTFEILVSSRPLPASTLYVGVHVSFCPVAAPDGVAKHTRFFFDN